MHKGERANCVWNSSACAPFFPCNADDGNSNSVVESEPGSDCRMQHPYDGDVAEMFVSQYNECVSALYFMVCVC